MALMFAILNGHLAIIFFWALIDCIRNGSHGQVITFFSFVAITAGTSVYLTYQLWA